MATAVRRWGAEHVVAGCTALLTASPRSVPTGERLELAMVLGGLTDPDWLAGGKPPGHLYMSRVWAVRAWRYVWGEAASGAVLSALADEQWRVREMAAKVVALREIGAAADAVSGLGADEVPRVRAAAARAVAAVGEAEHADALRTLRDDPDPAVARAAATALRALSRRLDRDVR